MAKTMKSPLLASLLLSCAALAVNGCTPTSNVISAEQASDNVWIVDQQASRIGFESSFGGTSVLGGFRTWSANIHFDPANLAQSKATIEIDMGSVSANSDEIDGSLLGSDWFSVSLFPHATFRSTSIRHVAGEWYEVVGDLSIRNVTRSITMPLRIALTGDDAAVSGSLVIDRSSFEVGQGQWRGGDSVPLEVRVSIDMKARRASAPPTSATATNQAPPAQSGALPVAADDYRPAPAFPQQTRAPAPASPSRYQVEVLASGLEQPWAVAFLPNGDFLVTERPGRMRIIDKSGKMSAPIAGVPAVKAIAAEGLHDVVLDPDFEQNRKLYISYLAPLENDTPPVLQDWVAWLSLPAGEHEKQPFGYERVASATLSADGSRLENLRIISNSGNRRLVFAPDGNLLITAAPPAGGGIPVDMEPQLLGNGYGKVLRVRPDGATPADNPFFGKSGVFDLIYAYGLRDMEGAAIHPVTGRLWTVEHGPRGGDEINIIEPGRNYGFPIIGYGREYSGQLINGGKTAQDGLEQPVYFWTPSIAPSGLAFYTGKLFPEWRDSLFVGALAGQRLIRLQLDGDRVVHEEELLVDRGKRIRDVRTGPDGALYVLTADKNGELLRLTPPD